MLRPKTREPIVARNPWNAGTLEWLQEMPDKPWGVRSIPEIDARYPLWEQKDFMRDVDEGRFYLPDAEECLRETLVTSVIDARPQQCLRVAGPSYVTLVAAVFTGGAFIFATFHWWIAAGVSSALAVASFIAWLWSSAAVIPERESKDLGLGVTLPLYVTGPASVGWWAMFITMLADITAFVCLVFGYLYYWTIHRQFPPAPMRPLGGAWPVAALAALVGAWAATLVARRENRLDHPVRF